MPRIVELTRAEVEQALIEYAIARGQIAGPDLLRRTVVVIGRDLRATITLVERETVVVQEGE